MCMSCKTSKIAIAAAFAEKIEDIGEDNPLRELAPIKVCSLIIKEWMGISIILT